MNFNSLKPLLIATLTLFFTINTYAIHVVEKNEISIKANKNEVTKKRKSNKLKVKEKRFLKRMAKLKKKMAKKNLDINDPENKWKPSWLVGWIGSWLAGGSLFLLSINNLRASDGGFGSAILYFLSLLAFLFGIVCFIFWLIKVINKKKRKQSVPSKS